MKLEYKPVEYADVLELVAQARGEAYPDTAITVDELSEQLALRPKDLYRHIELVYVDGEFAGFWTLLREAMFAKEDTMHFRIAVRPTYEGLGIEREATEKAVSLAKEIKLGKVVSVARSSHPATVQPLIDLGFTMVNKDVISRLLATDFEPEKWKPVSDEVAGRGIRIVSGVELDRTEPDWTRKAYDMHVELMDDVPFAASYTPPPYERWCNKIHNAKMFDLDLMFFAMDGSHFVGETALFRVANETRNYLTGLTGVISSYRRQKIALALKVVAISKAIEDGAKSISTGNEEDNPIRLLNDQLGYIPLYEELGYSLSL